jgi:hypothetical protein
MNEPPDNPMQHPDEQPTGTDDAPQFGRLLMVLAAAVLALAALAFGAAALYS